MTSIKPIPVLLKCHHRDFVSIVAAAAAANLDPEEYCKLAIHLAVKMKLIESRVRKRCE